MADRYIPEHRRTQFKAKNTFKPDELRRRREEQQVEIRKAKREENLAKRRGIGTGDQRPGASLGAAPDSDDDTAPSESQVSHVLDFLHPMRFPPCLLAPGYCLPLTVAHLAIYSPLPIRIEPLLHELVTAIAESGFGFDGMRIKNFPTFLIPQISANSHFTVASPPANL